MVKAVAAQMKRAKRLMNSGKYCIKRRLKFIAWMVTETTTTTVSVWKMEKRKIMDIVEGFVDVKGFNYLCFFSCLLL